MNNLECGFEERLRKRMQVVLLGWCTVHTEWQQRQLRMVQLKYIIAAGYFADFFSCCCVLHIVQDWKFLIKLWDRWVRVRFVLHTELPVITEICGV
jgi:hypothetical protein